MSRTIKFRAWHKQERVMCHIQYLHFNPQGDAYGVLVKGQLLSIDDFEIMQFTGLLDKNGKEIYESDICQIDSETHEVYWNEDRWGLQEVSPKHGSGIKFDYDNGDYYQGHEINWDTCEVIGNIHENSNPLEEQ